MANKKTPRIASLYEEYKSTMSPEEAAAGESLKTIAEDSATFGNEGDPVTAPAGYKPLTSSERKQWNDLIRYMHKNKALGNPELDKRDKTLGKDIMEQYRKENPDFSITEARIPDIQYEFQIMKNSGSLPNVPADSYAGKETLPWFRQELAKKTISPVDGWLGSLTSQQAYPEVGTGPKDKHQKTWGTDYDAADKYFKTKPVESL